MLFDHITTLLETWFSSLVSSAPAPPVASTPARRQVRRLETGICPVCHALGVYLRADRAPNRRYHRCPVVPGPALQYEVVHAVSTLPISGGLALCGRCRAPEPCGCQTTPEIAS